MTQRIRITRGPFAKATATVIEEDMDGALLWVRFDHCPRELCGIAAAVSEPLLPVAPQLLLPAVVAPGERR